jgi:hypothetical protein
VNRINPRATIDGGEFESGSFTKEHVGQIMRML